MRKFVVGTLLALIAVLALVGSPVVDGEEELNVKADIVLLTTVPRHITDDKVDQNLQIVYLMQSYVNFSRYFRMTPDETMFAAFSPIGVEGRYEKAIQPFTDNRTALEKTLVEWNVKKYNGTNYQYGTHEGLSSAREYMFQDGMPKGRKPIIVFYTGMGFGYSPSGRRIQRDGGLVYGICQSGDANVLEFTIDQSTDFFVINEADTLKNMNETMPKVKDAIHRDLCGWKSVCAYDAGGQCQHRFQIDEEQSFIIKDGGTRVNADGKVVNELPKWKGVCEKDFPPKKLSCQYNKTQCLEQCNKEWPLTHDPTKVCDSPILCGKEIGRDGSPPLLMENCPNHKCASCPAPPPPPQEEIERKKQEEQKTSTIIGIAAAVLIFVLLAIAGIVIGLVVYLSKRKKIQEDQNRQLATTMEATMKQTFIQAMVPGADKALAADLEDFLQSRISKRAPPPDTPPSTGGAKSTGGKAGPPKSSTPDAKAGPSKSSPQSVQERSVGGKGSVKERSVGGKSSSKK